MTYVGPWGNRRRWKQEEERQSKEEHAETAHSGPSTLLVPFGGPHICFQGGLPLQATPIPQDVLKQPSTYPSHHPLANCLTKL